MERLFVYGSLQPGRANEHVLAALEGDWQPATVRGRLVEAGWGAAMGYPALVLDEAGVEVHGYLFASVELAGQWDELDRFEGAEYERVVTPVRLEGGQLVQASLYVLRPR